MRSIIFVSALFILAAGPAFAADLTGAAIAVTGDTLTINGQTVHIWSIKADNLDSPRGWVSQLYLKTAISAGPVSCTQKTDSQYQCTTVEGSDIGSLMVQTGQAVAIGQYYEHEQSIAQLNQRGVWQLNEDHSR